MGLQIINNHAYTTFLPLSAVACVLQMFVSSPTLFLILYPTRLFRRYVSCCGFTGGILCTCLWNHFRESTRI